jgi:hypothetical protein
MKKDAVLLYFLSGGYMQNQRHQPLRVLRQHTTEGCGIRPEKNRRPYADQMENEAREKIRQDGFTERLLFFSCFLI